MVAGVEFDGQAVLGGQLRDAGHGPIAQAIAKIRGDGGALLETGAEGLFGFDVAAFVPAERAFVGVL